MIPDFPVGGITCCCLGAAALYLLGRRFEWHADALKSVTKVNQLKDLAPLLDGASKVVRVSGCVGSDTPIKCEYSGLLGVIVEKEVEKQFLKRNDAGSWIQKSALMSSTCKQVPWYLAVMDDKGSIRIQRPHKGPFYVSGKTIDQLIANLGERSRLCKCASVCFTAFGIYLLAEYAVEYIFALHETLSAEIERLKLIHREFRDNYQKPMKLNYSFW